MKEALVSVSWLRSASTDVESQNFIVSVNSATVLDESLDSSVDNYQFWVAEKSLVAVSLTVFDGTNLSVPATLSFQVPDLTEPLAATDLTFQILETRDVVQE